MKVSITLSASPASVRPRVTLEGASARWNCQHCVMNRDRSRDDSYSRQPTHFEQRGRQEGRSEYHHDGGQRYGALVTTMLPHCRQRLRGVPAPSQHPELAFLTHHHYFHGIAPLRASDMHAPYLLLDRRPARLDQAAVFLLF